MLVATDLETTGLNPEQGVILEIGLVVVDDDLNVLHERSWVTSRELPTDAWFARIPPEVVQMHRKNGLFAEIESGAGVTLPEAASSIEEWWKQNVVTKGRYAAMDDKPVMIGSTINFDRRWIQAFLGQDFLDLWHYRSVDVSSVKELVRRWRPDCVYTPPAIRAHRALPDCHVTLDELAYYRKTVFA